jgi:hypothetical protein
VSGKQFAIALSSSLRLKKCTEKALKDIFYDGAYQNMLQSQRKEILDLMEAVDKSFSPSPLFWTWSHLEKFNQDIKTVMQKVLEYQSHVFELLQSGLPDDEEEYR